MFAEARLCRFAEQTQEGYRTLCVAYKQLSTEEYVQVDASLREARLALEDREEKLAAAYNRVETGMTLIGATAVEDRCKARVSTVSRH